MLTGSIFAYGLPCKKTSRMMKQLNIASISFPAYYSLLKNWVQPVIYRMWQNKQSIVLNAAKDDGGQLVLAGDGRADSPGHSAKYGTYTMMDMAINKIVDLQLLQV